jgi:hypothetical protein
MTTLFLLFGLILLLLGSPFLLLAYLRIRRPHSGEVNAEQARLHRKNGVSPPAPNQPEKKHAFLEWVQCNIWTILLVVIGIILLWWSHDTKVTQLGNWGKNQPLFLLVLWGFLAALIKLHTGALGKAAEVLQWVVAGGVLLALFLGSPVGEWFTKDESTGSTAHKATVGARQVLTMAPGSESERVPTRPGHRIDFSGEGFSVYNVYRDGTVCSEGCKNGPLREVYVKNLKNEQNSVSYEFVRP